jgi:hypothetical protein
MLKLLKMLKIFYKNYCACFDATCSSWRGVPNSCNSKVSVPWDIPGIEPSVSSRSVVEHAS